MELNSWKRYSVFSIYRVCCPYPSIRENYHCKFFAKWRILGGVFILGFPTTPYISLFNINGVALPQNKSNEHRSEAAIYVKIDSSMKRQFCCRSLVCHCTLFLLQLYNTIQ